MIWKFFSKAHPNRELFSYIHKTFHVKPKNIALYETALRHASAAEEIPASESAFFITFVAPIPSGCGAVM